MSKHALVGIIAAMDKELELIRGRMADPVVEECGGILFTRGKLAEHDVVCAVCGVGKVFAAMCTEAMIIKYSPALVVNTGVGGTITPKLSIGDIAISHAVCQHDMDTTALGDRPGLISGINKVFFEADTRAVGLLDMAASRLGFKAGQAVIATGDRFVADKALKEKLLMTFGADVCDMEGGAVAQVCCLCKVPFVVIRAVSDNADGDSPVDYPAFAAESARRSAALVCELVAEF